MDILSVLHYVFFPLSANENHLHQNRKMEYLTKCITKNSLVTNGQYLFFNTEKVKNVNACEDQEKLKYENLQFSQN